MNLNIVTCTSNLIETDSLLAENLHRGTRLFRFKYTALRQRRTKYMSLRLQAMWIDGVHTQTRTHTLSSTHTNTYIHTRAGTHMHQWTSHQRITTQNNVSPDSCSSLRFNATRIHNNNYGLFWINSNASYKTEWWPLDI